MSQQYLQNVQIYDDPGVGRDATGKILRVVGVTEVGSYTETGGSNVGTAGAAVSASLAAVTGKTNYLRGFTITADSVAVSLGAVTVTVTGLAAGTLNFRLQPVVGQASIISKEFSDPLAASGQNQAIAVSVPAITTGPIVAVEAHGIVN